MPLLKCWEIVILVSLGVGATSSPLGAQERPRADSQESPPPLPRFFDRPIDYWQRGLAFEPEMKPNSPNSATPDPAARKSPPSDWGQIVKQPDGTFAYHELPRPLAQVLEDPSPQNIRVYFEWKLGRTEKILRAAEAMKEYRSALLETPEREEPASSASDAREAALMGPGPAPAPSTHGVKEGPREPFTILYFHRSGCPHCDTQDLILAGWQKARPEGKLVQVDFGEKPELWQKYHVRGTPSMIIENERTRVPVFLEGVSQESELDKALLESGHAVSVKPSGEGGGK